MRKGTPRDVVDKVNADIAAFTRSEKERWGRIIRQANIRLE
jgi:hypothetical protein